MGSGAGWGLEVRIRIMVMLLLEREIYCQKHSKDTHCLDFSFVGLFIKDVLLYL